MRKLAGIAILAAVALTAAPLSAQTTVPAGTPIIIVLNQSVSSRDAKVGEAVAASVARDVIVGGKTVISHGADASVLVSAVQASGRLSTPAKLSLRLDAVTVNGKSYRVSCYSVGSAGKSHAKRDAVAIGGGAAAGALIGGLAGGGKGAAIGTAAGAGAGTAGAAATGKKDITYSAETKLTFRLRSSVAMK